MRKMILIWLILISLWGATQSLAQNNADVLYENDFEAANPLQDFETAGDWSIATEDDGNKAVQVEGSGSLALEIGEEWRDYTLEMDVLIRTGDLMIEVRAGEDGCAGYDFIIEPLGSHAVIRSGVSGNSCRFLETIDEMFSNQYRRNLWVRVRLNAIGNRFRLYFDDVLILEGTDSAYDQGTVRIFTMERTDAMLDNIKVIDESRLSSSAASTSPLDRLITLNAHESGYQAAIAELEDLQLVPEDDGELLFVEDYAFFRGQGAWFTPLAYTSPRADVIMAGNLTFEVGATDEVETCMLSARIITNTTGQAIEYLGIGLINDGSVLLVDRFSDYSDPAVELADLGLDYSVSHHILFMAIDNEVTVFIDGELVFDHVSIRTDWGVYGISLIGATSGSRCEGRNIWVYEYDKIDN